MQWTPLPKYQQRPPVGVGLLNLVGEHGKHLGIEFMAYKTKRKHNKKSFNLLLFLPLTTHTRLASDSLIYLKKNKPDIIKYGHTTCK